METVMSMPTLQIVLMGLAVLVDIVVPLIHRPTRGRIVSVRWKRDIDVEQEHWVRRTSYWGYPANSRNRNSRVVTYWDTETRWVTKHEYVFGKMQTRTVPESR